MKLTTFLNLLAAAASVFGILCSVVVAIKTDIASNYGLLLSAAFIDTTLTMIPVDCYRFWRKNAER